MEVTFDTYFSITFCIIHVFFEYLRIIIINSCLQIPSSLSLMDLFLLTDFPPRILSASGKETATAKFLTSEHAWRGGDGGMCSFWRGEFLGRFSSWVNLLKHPQKWHIRPFCPRALKNKKFKWSFVHHTQNSLFQKHFQCFFLFS